MKLHSKILCYLLIATVLLPQFLSFQPQKTKAATVSPPPPSEPCAEQANSATGISSSIDIVCTFNGQKLTFSNRSGSEGTVTLSPNFSDKDKHVLIYKSITTFSQQFIMYWIAVEVDATTQTKKILTVLYPIPSGIIPSNPVGVFGVKTSAGENQYLSSGSFNGPGIIIPPPSFSNDTPGVMGSIQKKQEVRDAFNNNPSADTTIYLKALEAFAVKINADKGIGVVTRTTVFKAETIAKCSKFTIVPLSSPDGTGSTGASAFFKAIQDSMLASIKSNVPDTAKQTAQIQKINDMFKDPSVFLSKQADEELFRTYYSTDLKGGAPNVRPDGGMYSKYAGRISDIDAKMPLGYNLSQYLGALGPIMRGNAGAAIGTSQLTLGAIGAIFGGGVLAVPAVAVGGFTIGTTIGDSINKWLEGKEVDAVLKAMVPNVVAYYYFKANINFNKCAGEQKDPAAFTDVLLIESQLDSLFFSMSDLLNNAATGDIGAGKTACDEIKAGWIMTGIAQAICGFAILFKKWANSFICMAEGYLEASLGVKQGNTKDTDLASTEASCANQNYKDNITGIPGPPSGTTPAGTTATPGTPTSPTDDINQQATTICLASKLAMDPITWNTGPCLTEDLNGSGKAVDLVHVPRIDIDNTIICTNKTNLIKLNVSDCSVQ